MLARPSADRRSLGEAREQACARRRRRRSSDRGGGRRRTSSTRARRQARETRLEMGGLGRLDPVDIEVNLEKFL